MSSLLPYLLPLVKHVAPLVLSALTSRLRGSAKTFKEHAKRLRSRHPKLTSERKTMYMRTFKKKKPKHAPPKRKPKKKQRGGALGLAGGSLHLAGGALRLAGQRHLDMGNRRLINFPMTC